MPSSFHFVCLASSPRMGRTRNGFIDEILSIENHFSSTPLVISFNVCARLKVYWTVNTSLPLDNSCTMYVFAEAFALARGIERKNEKRRKTFFCRFFPLRREEKVSATFFLLLGCCKKNF